MAAGDYVVRYNASNVDVVPNQGSDLLLLWDTASASVGSGITYSAGTFTLGETGKFLVLASDQYGSTATSARRHAPQTKLTLGGTELQEGFDVGIVREASGAQEHINFVAAIIDVTSTTGNADELQVRAERFDNVSSTDCKRIADRSGITIIKLDDSLNYARYESSATFTASATDNARTTCNLGTTLEQDSPFTRTGNSIDIATNNLVLAVYSSKGYRVQTTRKEVQFCLELAGVEVPGSWTQCYIRGSSANYYGGASNVCLLEPTSGDDLELLVVSREASDLIDWETSLQLVELPASTKAIIVQATTGNFNTAATNFSWDTNPYIDTDVFTHTATNANVDVDVAGDYLVMASQAETDVTGADATRAVPALSFRVNTADIETTGSSSYHRNSGTAEHAAVSCATLLTGLSINDSIYSHNDRIGTVTTSIPCDDGAMSVIQLSSFLASDPFDVRPQVDALALTEHQASVELAITVNAGVDTLSVTTYAANVDRNYNIVCNAGLTKYGTARFGTATYGEFTICKDTLALTSYSATITNPVTSTAPEWWELQLLGEGDVIDPIQFEEEWDPQTYSEYLAEFKKKCH